MCLSFILKFVTLLLIFADLLSVQRTVTSGVFSCSRRSWQPVKASLTGMGYTVCVRGDSKDKATLRNLGTHIHRSTWHHIREHTNLHQYPCDSIKSHNIRLFQITNLMHNSFIFQQYVCYITLLNMFRAARCSSSGGPIVSPQPLVSSPWKSVNHHILIK